MGNTSLTVVTLTATTTVTTTCTNPGGKVAPGQTKTESVTATQKYMSDQNGHVSFSLTTATPTPGSCPNGNWTGAVTDVSFSNVTLLVNGQQVYP